MISVQIKKAFADFTLDVAFDAPAGVIAIFGRSGSGKTTLINAIAGLVTPDEGRIVIADWDLTHVPIHQRGLGYVFQDARLFPHMTVAKNLDYGGDHERDRLIDMLGLGGLLPRFPKALSGGEKSRVALGRALMSNPTMLLLDEPLAALDAQRKAEILPYLERLRDEVEVPMIYVSHDMSEVARLANTIVVLDQGRVVRAGGLGDVLSHPASVPLLGERDAGAVMLATVMEHDHEDTLTALEFEGGRLILPGHIGQIGQNMRVRVPAQDVILARVAPSQISARNVLPVKVSAIEIGQGPGVAVGLMAGETALLARITKASYRQMDLAVGSEIYAIIKATAVGPNDAGQ